MLYFPQNLSSAQRLNVQNIYFAQFHEYLYSNTVM